MVRLNKQTILMVYKMNTNKYSFFYTPIIGRWLPCLFTRSHILLCVCVCARVENFNFINTKRKTNSKLGETRVFSFFTDVGWQRLKTHTTFCARVSRNALTSVVNFRNDLNYSCKIRSIDNTRENTFLTNIFRRKSKQVLSNNIELLCFNGVSKWN